MNRKMAPSSNPAAGISSSEIKRSLDRGLPSPRKARVGRARVTPHPPSARVAVHRRPSRSLSRSTQMKLKSKAKSKSLKWTVKGNCTSSIRRQRHQPNKERSLSIRDRRTRGSSASGISLTESGRTATITTQSRDLPGHLTNKRSRRARRIALRRSHPTTTTPTSMIILSCRPIVKTGATATNSTATGSTQMTSRAAIASTVAIQDPSQVLQMIKISETRSQPSQIWVATES